MVIVRIHPDLFCVFQGSYVHQLMNGKKLYMKIVDRGHVRVCY